MGWDVKSLPEGTSSTALGVSRKATDFNFQEDLKFDLETGLTTFRDSRLVIFDSNAIGILRQSLLDDQGWEKARRFFLRSGFQNGYSDFLWSLTGYASGWCTAFFGSPLLAIEPVCVGKGDDRCEWKIQAPEAWEEEVSTGSSPGRIREPHP